MGKALIFDCDGVLADTERDGHLPAINAAFLEFGLPIEWSQNEYGERLAIAGGKERLAKLFTPQFARSCGVPESGSELRDFIAGLHARKIELFAEIVAAGKVAPRPGVARLARELFERGWKLAVASTSAAESVRAVLAAVVGDTFAREFAIFAGDIVAHKKPAPDIYLHALRELGIAAGDAVAIEDSRNGLLAARAAGIRCLVTLSTYTQNEAMEGALFVVSSLGDPGRPAIEIKTNGAGLPLGDFITADVIALAGTVPSP